MLRSIDNVLDDTQLIVHGGHGLRGDVQVSGFKHALVSLVGVACAANVPCVIRNCPVIEETTVLMELVRGLGGSADLADNALRLHIQELKHGYLDPELASAIHGSVYLVPALLARTGSALVPTSGGCQIGDRKSGARPVRHYVSVLERFGARVDLDSAQNLRVQAKRLKGCDIDLLEYTRDRTIQTGPLYSGASKMAILTAAVAQGRSTLKNLYPKPDVTELLEVLRKYGVEVEGGWPEHVTIHGRGPEGLHCPVTHTLVADLIEVVTWLCCGALLGDDQIRVTGAELERAVRALQPEMAVLAEMGVTSELRGNILTVTPMRAGRSVDILVSSPGVYSDNHPFFALLATGCRGRSRITETVWSKRFGYVHGLNRLGAQLEHKDHSVVVHGGTIPHRGGQAVSAGDLRSAAVLLLAALAVDGTTIIHGAHHLKRGYTNLPATLCKLGAKISCH